MPTTVRARQGDTIDLICWLFYGKKQFRGSVERVLEANRDLADKPLILEPGTLITLPDPPAEKLPAGQIKLWD